jgi:hypothetical protein
MKPVENAQSKSDYLFWQGQACLIAGEAEHLINCRIFLVSPGDLRIYSDNPFGFRLLALDNNGLTPIPRAQMGLASCFKLSWNGSHGTSL